MFRHANTNDIPLSIRIKYAELIRGQYEWDERNGGYKPVTHGTHQTMLMILFECFNPDIDYFYVTDKDFLPGFHHTTKANQRSFFFPWTKDMLYALDSIKINGASIDPKIYQQKYNTQSSHKIIGAVIGKSRLIKECIASTQMVITCVGQITAFDSLKNNLVSLEDIADLNYTQLKLFLQSKGISKPNFHGLFADKKHSSNTTHSGSKNKEEIPDCLLCPITQEVKVKPVLCTLDGKSYEESAIRDWLINHRISPYNRKEMQPDQTVDDVLKPNRDLEDAIEYIRQIKPELFEQQQDHCAFAKR